MEKEKQTPEISGVMDMKIVTPTLQIVGSAGAAVYTRKMTIPAPGMDEKGRRVWLWKSIPFLSGESLRGIARRRLSVPVMRKIVENSRGKRLSPKVIHMFIDGGMTSMSMKFSYERETEYRKKFPFFSVFGVGLSLHGKLFIQDAFPVIDDPEWPEKVYAHISDFSRDDVLGQIDNLLGRFHSSAKDDILDHKPYIFEFLTADEVREWEAEVARRAATRNDDREGAETGTLDGKEKEREKRGTTQYFQMVEYIKPGTTLRTQIGVFEGETLTDAEKGCVLLAVAELVKNRRIGANQRKNWGLYDASLDLTVDGTELSLVREVDKTNFLKDSMLDLGELDGRVEKYIAAFTESLENITVDDLNALRDAMEKDGDKEGRKS